ncbi:hypothetical protein CBLAS_0008 [Campylobacter blaseri]|uniref:Uncharacterized protein n=1 Tax=Campylobacter blaseri TaxID=2042961 RepID=A0A2P8R3J5_9BACT|nr:hypothetical protein [Campylobacter blaseri]PSM53058.1 hypothetical protein CQ405_00445 [Campylobacter blaseri]PSM54525.1 hypothetical protein CRN67_00445 [Campylobacter blaseri]QKF85227.1 hypothetical protein CBLAS_0008 [Campylobacter blaseri]
MSIKTKFFLFFKELFVFNHKSLEFRAKIFTAMFLAKKTRNEEDYDKLREIIKEIYPDNKTRVDILMATIKEYVKLADTYKSISLDSILRDIDRDLKYKKRYIKKIDFSHLRRIINLSEDEDDILIQQRVYEFLVAEKKRYE